MIHISYRESPVAFYEAVENGFVHQMFPGCEVPVATELTAERSPVESDPPPGTECRRYPGLYVTQERLMPPGWG